MRRRPNALLPRSRQPAAENFPTWTLQSGYRDGSKIAYKSFDFGADKQIQYKELRMAMGIDFVWTMSQCSLVASKLLDDFDKRSKQE